MPYGYHGKILHINLTLGQIEVEQPDEEFYRRYWGGSALGLYYLLRHTGANADPLGPENTLALAVSPPTGAPVPGQSRMTATAKSPLTGAVGDSQCGGYFPAELKFAGFDAIVIRGRAAEPVHLWIHNGEVELRPASHLWGKVTAEAEELIKRELGAPKAQVLQCGPAGERLARFAALINMSNRANGRTGMGAVMGSKNLKAVTVRGDHRPAMADAKTLNELARWGAANTEAVLGNMGPLGTAGVLGVQNFLGGLPTRNWDSGIFELAHALDGQTLADTVLKGRDTCYACAVRCKRVVEILEEPYRHEPRYGGPEYESLAALGSYCGVGDLAAVCYANQLCNMYGLDTISCGATIAWAMDCFEHGLITPQDTGGVELRFGDAGAMAGMVKMIAERKGFGDLLAEGSARAAARIGRGTQDLVVAVKNQELPAHMPQIKRSLALIYAVNPFGADHQSSEHDPSYNAFPERAAQLGLTTPQPAKALNEAKVQYALTTEWLYSALDTLGLCQFVYGAGWQLMGPGQTLEVVRAVTGWDVTMGELLQLGERRLNLMRAFNAREGIGRESDTLPKKLQRALTGGPSDGVLVTEAELERAKDWYYAMAGWNVATGSPTREKLDELGLAGVADEIGV